MEYKIVKKDMSYGLEKEVNKLIQEGWKPLGGMAVSRDTSFYQAMIRIEEEDSQGGDE